MTPPARTSLIISCLLATAALSHAAVRFIPATPENTRLADGPELVVAGGEPSGPLQIVRSNESPAPDNRWHRWKTKGIACFATSGAACHDAPILRTTVDGLHPNANYQVDGFFRAVIDDGTKPSPRGDIRMGLTIARTEAFGPKFRQGLSCMIGVDHPSKRVAQWQLQIADSQPADHPDFPLFRASLGVARSDAQGTLVVFIDDQPNDTLAAATLYEGVAVSPAPVGLEPAVGTGSPQVLVESVRVGDLETMDRELAAGADLNTPDREGLTALFYACLAGDTDLVGRFLKASAKPDCPGQRLTPLWAAARNGDARLVNILLDTGAEITTACLADRQLGGFMRFNSSLQINPVSAALLSGSVETLEALLKRQPALNLGKAAYGQGYEFKEDSGWSPPTSDLIRLSMTYENFDMVRWLIERGHSLNLLESPSLPYTRQLSEQHGARSIMIRSIMRQPPRMDIVDALAARGVPLVVLEDALSDPVIAPWDALSAAVFKGHVDWVRRWLPLAKDAGQNYGIRLTALAESSDCAECAQLVREAFPNLPRPRYRWTKEQILAERERLAGGLEGLAPRTTAAPRLPSSAGMLRLVVIGSGSAAGPADALAALASTDPAVVVIDREEIAAALTERSIAAALPLSPSQLNDLGDTLKADVIVTAASFGQAADAVLRFEAHDVGSGLTRHRVFELAKDFAPDTFARDFLAELRAKMNASLSGKSITAITLLSITAEPGRFHESALARTLHTGLIQEIDASSGLAALTRDQLAPLVAERALGRAGSLWGAAWTIEGGLRMAETQGDVTLTLRLRPVSDETKSHDIAVQGPVTAPRDLVLRAWAELRQHIDDSPPAADDHAGRAERESARLAREAEWLLKTELAWQAAPLADAALYLGGDRLERLMLRQKCHWAGCHVINPRRQWTDGRGMPWDATGHPLARHIHLFYLYWLEEHLELLRLTSATLDDVLVLFREDGRSRQLTVLRSLWEDVMRLTEFRCRLVPESMSPADKAVLVEFDRELRQLWQTIASHTPGYLTSNSKDGLANRLVDAQRITIDFRQLPWLGDLLARKLLTAADGPASPSNERSAFGLVTETTTTEQWIYPGRDSIAALLGKHIDGNEPLSTLRQAEISWLRSHGPARIPAAKSLAAVWSKTLASRLHPPNRILDPMEFAKSQPSHGFGVNMFAESPFGMPLPSLVAASRACVDMTYRAGIYHLARQHLAFATAGNGQWQQVAKSLAGSFTREIPILVERQTPAGGFDLLLVAARETDGLFNTTIANSIEPVVRKVRPKESPSDSFGASGGFRVATRADAIAGDLLADLRTELPGKHAFIIFHAVDPRDRNLLWLVMQPMPGDELILHEDAAKTKQWERFTMHQPWLLCVDCRDGSVVRRVNLVQAAFGSDAPLLSPMTRVAASFENDIAFNDQGLLSLIRWRFNGRERFQALALNRMDGSVTNSMPLLTFLTSDLTNKIRPNLAGLGQDFYLIGNDERGSDHYRIFKLSPGRAPVSLNLPGRRPVESPFDAADRRPALLRVDAGKILVASSWDHHSYYDPATGHWSQKAGMGRDAFFRHVQSLDRRTYQATLYPQHILPLEDTPGGRFAPRNESEPGALVYYKNAKLPLRLPLNLPFDSPYPGTFRISPMPVGRVANLEQHFHTHPAESVTIQDLARSDMVRPAILNQTDDYLIVGLFLEIQGAAGIRSWSYEYLPCLWKIPVHAVREKLSKDQEPQ